MKKRVGEYKGKPIVEGGTPNEIRKDRELTIKESQFNTMPPVTIGPEDFQIWILRDRITTDTPLPEATRTAAIASVEDDGSGHIPSNPSWVNAMYQLRQDETGEWGCVFHVKSHTQGYQYVKDVPIMLFGTLKKEKMEELGYNYTDPSNPGYILSDHNNILMTSPCIGLGVDDETGLLFYKESNLIRHGNKYFFATCPDYSSDVPIERCNEVYVMGHPEIILPRFYIQVIND